METTDKILLMVIAVSCGPWLLGWVVGLFLPREYMMKGTLKSEHPPQAVWEAITDHAKDPTWWKGLERVERLPDKDGKEVWRHIYKDDFRLILYTEEKDPPHHLRWLVREAGGGTGWNQKWDFEIVPEGSGCIISLRLTVDFPGRSGRFWVRFFDLLLAPVEGLGGNGRILSRLAGRLRGFPANK
jgi:hypothetical protein